MITLCFIKLEELNTKQNVGIFWIRICEGGYHEIPRFSSKFSVNLSSLFRNIHIPLDTEYTRELVIASYQLVFIP